MVNSVRNESGMRYRTFIVVALLAFAAFPATVFVLNFLRKSEGSLYHGLATSDWEREIVNWELSRPRCCTGGCDLWITRQPSVFANLCDSFGIPHQQDRSPLALVQGDPKALPVLAELIRSSDPKARRIGIEGIRRIGDGAKSA